MSTMRVALLLYSIGLEPLNSFDVYAIDLEEKRVNEYFCRGVQKGATKVHAEDRFCCDDNKNRYEFFI